MLDWKKYISDAFNISCTLEDRNATNRRRSHTCLFCNFVVSCSNATDNILSKHFDDCCDGKIKDFFKDSLKFVEGNKKVDLSSTLQL